MKNRRLFAILFSSISFVFVCLWLIMSGETVVYAATFTVDSTIDVVDANPGDGSCATSGGVCTLRAAIQEANALPGDDIITLPAGTYTLSISGADEDAAATGDLDITENLTINGAGSANAIVDGNLLDRVFDVFAVTTLTGMTIQNGEVNDPSIFTCGGGGTRTNSKLTIQNSAIINNATVNSTGGGICVATFSDILIMNSTISDNNARGWSGGGIDTVFPANISLVNSTVARNQGYYGGGIRYRVGNGSTVLSLETSQIISNTASGGGAGVYFSANGDSLLNIVASTFEGNHILDFGDSSGAGLAIAGSNNTTIIQDSIFRSNVNERYGGGGIANFSDDSIITISNTKFFSNSGMSSGGGISNQANNITITISNSEFANNTGYSGGALINSGDFVEMNVQDSQFTGNAANGGSGGAVYFSTGQDSAINVEGSVFNNNTATLNGGAFTNVATTATITSTTFSNNHGANGGAIAVLGNLDVSNSTFSGNRANESGGGLFANSMTDNIGLNNSTIAYNVADYDNDASGNGGGFALTNGASMLVTNSIIATNTDLGGESPDCDSPYSPVSNGYNLVGQGDGCNWSASTGDLVGTAVSPINPILEPLTGLPATHPLGIGSPAIDAGSPGPVSGLPPNCEAVDQNGVVRPFDGDGDGTAVCDMGAFEWVDWSYVYLPMIVK